VQFENQECVHAYLINSLENRIDTIQIKNNVLLYSSDKLEEPTLFKLEIEGVNTIKNPFYLVLSEEETELKFNTLIVPKKNDLFQNYKINKPIFMKDPNANIALYDFLNKWVEFSELYKNEKDEEKHKKLLTHFINMSELIVIKNRGSFVAAIITDFLFTNKLIDKSISDRFLGFLDEEIMELESVKRIEEVAGYK